MPETAQVTTYRSGCTWACSALMTPALSVDRMTVDELDDRLKAHGLEIRSRLFTGSYAPQPVQRVEIPRASRGVDVRGRGSTTHT